MKHIVLSDRRPPSSLRPHVIPLFALAVLVSLLAGCAQEPPRLVANSPTAPALVADGSLDLAASAQAPIRNQGLVDLTPGGRAEYRTDSHTRTVYDDPSRPPEDVEESSVGAWTLEGPIPFRGLDYVKVIVTFDRSGEEETNVLLYRQDRSGYYQVFPVLTQDLSSALGPPGETSAWEKRLLPYPLHPGRTWEDAIGGQRWRVSGREEKVTPAGTFSAWRVEHTLVSDDRPYREVEWYSTPGRIAVEGMAELELRDQAGQRIGTQRYEWRTELTSWTPGAAVAAR